MTATLPFSTPTSRPADPNSEITGPGAKGVGPAGTITSLGAICPAFAGAGVLLFCSAFDNLKGLSRVKINAGIPKK